jgi:hypothetical protein
MKVLDAAEEVIRFVAPMQPAEAASALATALGRVCRVKGGLSVERAVEIVQETAR